MGSAAVLGGEAFRTGQITFLVEKQYINIFNECYDQDSLHHMYGNKEISTSRERFSCMKRDLKDKALHSEGRVSGIPKSELHIFLIGIFLYISFINLFSYRC